MEQFPSVDFTASFHFLFICHLLFSPKVLNVKYHGLRGSASPVLTATSFVNGRWQFSTPTEFGTCDYVAGPYGCAKFGANPSMGGFRANG